MQYAYDALDRLTAKATPEGTLSYTYYRGRQSGNHRLLQRARRLGDLHLRRSQPARTVVDDNLPGQNTTAYTYDPASNVATVNTPTDCNRRSLTTR